MLLLAMSVVANAIVYGTNGSNTPENLTPEVRQLIVEAWPSGQPYVLRVRNDKDWEGAMPDDLILNVIALDEELKASGSWLEIVYTFNTRGQKTITENFYGFDTFLSFGVPVVVEFGNEEFSDVAGHLDFADYYAECSPILQTLTSRGYTGNVLWSIAPRPQGINGARADQTTWNNEAAAIVNSKAEYQPVMHLYANYQDCPVLGALQRDKLPVSLVGNGYVQEKDDFFQTLTEQALSAPVLEQTMTYAAVKFPGKKVYMTEMGFPVATSNLANTIGYEMTFFYALNTLSSYDNIAMILRHNGATRPNTGIISAKKWGDVYLGEYVPRMALLTYKLFFSNAGKTPFYNNTSAPMSVDGDAVYIGGQYFYSSSGWCEWWAQGSVPSYEVKELQSSSGTVPSASFGYYQYKQPCDTVIVAYDTVVNITYDTIGIDPSLTTFCSRCESSWWFRLFNKNLCKTLCVESVEIVMDTVITPIWGEDCDTVPVDTIPDVGIQPIDADTLHFYNETQLRDWCAAYGMGYWEVQPPKFNYSTQIQDVVPYKSQKGCTLRASIGGTDSTFMAPDATYWFKPDGCQGEGWGAGQCIPNNMHFLHESLYYGLEYCSMRDHLHLAKHEREMRPCFCDEGDLFGVIEYVTNPFTGQVVAFHDIYRWSNRYGYNLWNENLALYMVWPELAEYNTVEFQLDTYHPATGCDYTFREYFPGHATMTLYFKGQKLINGVVTSVTIADVYDAELGR